MYFQNLFKYIIQLFTQTILFEKPLNSKLLN